MKILGLLLIFCCTALAEEDAFASRLAALAETAKTGEFPYQVSMRVNGRHVCGGTLIDTSHVVTAAHCVFPLIIKPYHTQLPEQVTIEVGSNILGGGQVFPVKRISFHKEFDPSLSNQYMLPNDIGIITLAKPCTESAKVAPLKLPTTTLLLPYNSEVVVSGWGSASLFSPGSNVLQKTIFYAIPRDTCEEFYRKALGKTILDTQICAARSPGYGTCQGDSGGPLAYQGHLMGIVSGGNSKCDDGNPDIYTDVRKYLSYINYELTNPGRDGPNSPAVSMDYNQAGHPSIHPSPPSFPQGPVYVSHPLYVIYPRPFAPLHLVPMYM